MNNSDLNISFSPTPNFAGIAKAAAGHHAWAGVTASARDLTTLLPEAVQKVKEGILAVLKFVWMMRGTRGKSPGFEYTHKYRA